MRQLLIGGVWGDEGDLDRVAWIGVQDLDEEAGVDHRCLRGGFPAGNWIFLPQVGLCPSGGSTWACPSSSWVCACQSSRRW